MTQLVQRLRIATAETWRTIHRARHDDRGTVVETVIIAAGLASLAIGVMVAISALVDAKVAGISL